ETGRLTVGLDESGLHAFEHMLYARKAMYAAVYYQRAVRAAGVMQQRLMWGAMDERVLRLAEAGNWSDEEFKIRLGDRLATGAYPFLEMLHRRLAQRIL